MQSSGENKKPCKKIDRIRKHDFLKTKNISGVFAPFQMQSPIIELNVRKQPLILFIRKKNV